MQYSKSTVLALAFLGLSAFCCHSNVVAQEFYPPALPPTDSQTLPGTVQAVPFVQPLAAQAQQIAPNGQILPAGASLPDSRGLPAVGLIPVAPNQQLPNQQLPNITLPAVQPVQVPWTQDLVKHAETKHDFGFVPTGSQQEHVFEFTNTTNATLNLISAKASCGCTRPTILTAVVEPGQLGQVAARFDTLKFRGEKEATVTVGVNKISSFTQYGELQFSVKGKIRKDVVMTPGRISFDNVKAATQSQQTVEMKYAGNPLWQIVRVESTNPNIVAEARESKREGGRISYQLIVTLKDSQPTGSFADELYVITNDKNVNRMPVSVAGRVQPTLEAAPIKLGVVRQGTKITKRFVIRGQDPFEIGEVRTNNENISFSLSTGAKKLHVLSYTLDTSEPGEIDATITIVTSETNPIEKSVGFSAQVVPTTETKN